MSDSLQISLLSLQARGGGVVGASIDLGGRRAASLVLDVLASTDVAAHLELETSPDLTTWRSAGPSTTIVIGRLPIGVVDADRYLRATLVSSGSSTLGLAGSAQTVYATRANVTDLAVQGSATVDFSDQAWANALIAATSLVDSHLGAAYTLPLVAWGADITLRTAQLAAYILMSARGFTPGSADEFFIQQSQSAELWLKGVALSRIRPDGLIDSAPDVVPGAFAVISDSRRGWGY